MTNGLRSDNAPGAAAEARRTHLRWWYIAVPLLVTVSIGQMDKIAIAVVMSNKQFLQDLSLVGKPGLVGLLMSGFLLSYSIFHFFWGPVVKKIGPRASALVGILLWGLTLILSGVAN